MCGILGHFGKIDQKLFIKMTYSQKHRGPDHSGHFFDHSRGISLGHTRLSIIDPGDHANGPFFSICKNYAIVFNGEIYNSPILRREIEAKFPDIIFKTKNSDTEALLNSYIAFKFEMFKKIEGMFAFIIIDFIQNKIIISRDHFGQKPLHYYTAKDGLTISSELTPIKILYKGKLRLDHLSLAKFWAYDCIPAPRTIFQQVYQLCPATYIVFDLKTLKKTEQKKFWDPSFARKETKNDKIEGIQTLLANSVEKCTLSDTPMALLLSGGLDSTTVGYFLKNKIPSLQSFNLKLQEKSFDETSFAQISAKAINSRHETFSLQQEYSDEEVFSLYERLDGPNGDSGLIPFYFLCRKLSREFKVVIGGDGGDELFLGYDTFSAFHFSKYLFPLFPILFGPLQFIGNFLPTSRKRLPLQLKIQRLAQGLKNPPPYWACIWMSSLKVSDINQLLDCNFSSEEIFSEALDLWEKTDSMEIDKFNSYYLEIYSPNKVLAKVDRASMLNGLEVRSPLFDKKLFEYCAQIPINHFHNGLQGKLALRKITSQHINQKIARKSKMGFGHPISTLVTEPFIIERILSQHHTNRNFLKSLLQDHVHRKYDYGQALWNAFVFSFF